MTAWITDVVYVMEVVSGGRRVATGRITVIAIRSVLAIWSSSISR